jgi:NAD(P)-dependent dehydrogenase (short-subunit alcohol dehydrogenase family)
MHIHYSFHRLANFTSLFTFSFQEIVALTSPCGAVQIIMLRSGSKYVFLVCLSLLLSEMAALKNVVVTGGNRGIGKAVCQQLLEQHPDVQVVLTSRNLERGRQAADEIRKKLGSSCTGRLDVFEMDTGSDKSVQTAASAISEKYKSLYGIVNNAGILQPDDNVMNVNYFGPRRVNDALVPLLERPGGRIVNVASASGPNFVSRLRNRDLKAKLTMPWLLKGGIQELDDLARSMDMTSNGYGTSKAFLNVYTSLHARSEPDLIINSVTPGFIATDMGASLGATNPVAGGAIPPLYCLMSPELENVPTGRYYGSDMKRSPIHFYRGPGDPVYEGPDWHNSLVEEL